MGQTKNLVLFLASFYLWLQGQADGADVLVGQQQKWSIRAPEVFFKYVG